MKRRDFIFVLAGSIAWPLAKAKGGNRTGHVRRVGFLSGVPLRQDIEIASFEGGLRDVGWLPGQDIVIEYRSVAGQLDRLPALAAELVDGGIELIVALSAPETKAAKEATKGSIPVVFAINGDPLGNGDVQTLAHPGGMITGLSQMHPELSLKQLELLKECVPAVSRVGVIWNSANPSKVTDWKLINSVAPSLGFVLQSHELRSPADLDGVLSAIRIDRPDALFTLSDPLTASLRVAIARFATEQRLPTIFPLRVFVDDGGLMSYGADTANLLRRVGDYIDKILNGAKPSDLPVEQPTKFELVINVRTAKAIGLSVPLNIIARADDVIE
jgi:putative ABC transport system substrate-binding protein